MSARYRLNGFVGSVPTYKTALMLALSGEPFDFKVINLMAGEHKQPAYLAISRFGQVPCLQDLSNGRAVVQSAAILEYLADKLGKFGGATLNERLDAREWLFWSFDRLAPWVFRSRLHAIGFRVVAPDVATDLAAMANMGLKVVDDHLAGRNWIIGDNPTIADIDIYAVLTGAVEAKFDLAGAYPQLGAFIARFEALPGFEARTSLLPTADRVS